MQMIMRKEDFKQQYIRQAPRYQCAYAVAIGLYDVISYYM